MEQRYLKDFSRQDIKKIATEYALSPLDVTHSSFEEKYNISQTTFYNIIKAAIVKGVVEDNIIRKMAYKARENSRIKAGRGGAERSRLYYSYLMEDRMYFEFSDKEKVEITIKYSESDLPKRKFAKQNAITVKLLEKTLYSALTENLVDDEIYKKVRQKALKNNSTNPKTIGFWEKIEDLRNNSYQAK